MKRNLFLIAISLIGVVFAGCGKDDTPDGNDNMVKEIKVTSISIAEGATISQSVESVEVIYDHDIALNPNVAITLNSNPISGIKIDENRLVAPLALSKGESYVFHIPSRAVVGTGTNVFANEVTLQFSVEGSAGIIDASLVAGNLTNENASTEAKNLYNFFKDNYGKRQLSGAMGDVAWATEFCDLIFKSTGAYPAIVGFDYIHLPSSPSNWIDYGDITPVKNAWDNGSIPAMTWHWNVPTSKDSSSISFDASSSEFKASNVLIDGTWENQIALADIEKVAGYLKLLKDAGIPVLWRPFHEAAGDYTWGAWFWWGNSGIETTKLLWKWLRDKLETEYGLDNLIWVWTVQTSDEGKLADISKLREAYPGNDLVDIVGADLYLDSQVNATSNFKLLYDLVEGKKIVALSECGNLLDVDSALKDRALWSYFMGWYDLENGAFGFHQWNKNNEWKKVLDNPLVINRGDFKL